MQMMPGLYGDEPSVIHRRHAAGTLIRERLDVTEHCMQASHTVQITPRNDNHRLRPEQPAEACAAMATRLD